MADNELNLGELLDGLSKVFSTIGMPEGCVPVPAKEADALRNRITELEKELAAEKGKVSVLQKQNEELRLDPDAKRSIIASRDVAVRQRDTARAEARVLRGQLETLQANALAAEKQVNEARGQARQYYAQICSLTQQVKSKQGMARRPDPDYNKLWKNYTACKNQRDSFQQTIATLTAELTSARQRIKALEEGEMKEVKVLVYKGQAYTAASIGEVIEKSAQRAYQIDELTRKLNAKALPVIKVGNFHYAESDVKQLLNTIDQLTRNNNELRNAKPILEIRGKYMSVSAIETALDLKDKYEEQLKKMSALLARAESTLRNTKLHVIKERNRRRELAEKCAVQERTRSYNENRGTMIHVETQLASAHRELDYFKGQNCALTKDLASTRRRLYDAQQEVKAWQDKAAEYLAIIQKCNNGPVMAASSHHVIELTENVRQINIKDPRDIEILIDNRVIRACDLPGMCDDLVEYRKVNEVRVATINELTTKVAQLSDMNGKLRQELQARMESLEKAQDAIRVEHECAERLNSTVSERDSTIRQLTIERNMLRGRLTVAENELNALKAKPQVEVQMEGGKSYMTTPIGMLPVDSDGMRQLCDAYAKYNSRLTALADYLRDWVTT